MPRRIQDIVPSERRSIRNISIEKSTKPALELKKAAKEIPTKEKVYEVPMHRIQEEETIEIPEEKPVRPQREKQSRIKRHWKLPILVLGIVVAIAGAAFLASDHYSHATFTIIPKVVPVTVNGTYVAEAIPGNSIVYELADFKGAATTSIPASSGPAVSTKAQGKVTLYNSFSAQPQRLVAGTRLADTSNRVYRLNSTVSVPGYTSKSGSIIPGSIGASVTADVAGDAYNIQSTDSLSDFKIPAYKGSPKYESIYARLATSISGGFIGTKKIVSPTLVATTTLTLQKQITTDLLKRASSTVPPGYIMYPDAYTTSFAQATIGGTDPKTATVSLQGNLHAILFKKTDLAARIAGTSTVLSFGSSAYSVPGLESLHFSIVNTKEFSADKKSPLIIRLQGDMKFIGIIPVEELKRKLAGAALSETESILKPYSQVIGSGSSGELTPPWAKVPNDPTRISIVVQE